jgi:hypothetical protein
LALQCKVHLISEANIPYAFLDIKFIYSAPSRLSQLWREWTVGVQKRLRLLLDFGMVRVFCFSYGFMFFVVQLSSSGFCLSAHVQEESFHGKYNFFSLDMVIRERQLFLDILTPYHHLLNVHNYISSSVDHSLILFLHHWAYLAKMLGNYKCNLIF